MGLPIFQMATIGIMPSFLKKLIYKIKGAKIGKNVKIGFLSIIKSKNIEIGDYTSIGAFSFIVADKFITGKRVKINSMVAIDTHNVEISDDSTIMEQVVIGGMKTPRSKIFIGKRVKIFPYSFLNPTEEIIIEDDVGIGGANYIFTHGSWQSELDGYPVSFAPIRIKKGTWFPWRVFVMPGVTVGEYCTIGAGSVITKDIPDFCLAAGSPAKVLREKDQYVKQLSNDEKIEKVIGYLNNFVEYMNFIDNKCSIIDSSDNIAIELYINNKKHIINCYLNLENNKYNFTCDIIISLFGLKEIESNKLIESNIIFFDIYNKSTYFKNVDIWYQVRDFFSRYGIRFNSVN